MNLFRLYLSLAEEDGYILNALDKNRSWANKAKYEGKTWEKQEFTRAVHDLQDLHELNESIRTTISNSRKGTRTDRWWEYLRSDVKEYLARWSKYYSKPQTYDIAHDNVELANPSAHEI